MLADMLGVRRETVTLHLSRLRRIGAVTVSGGRLAFDADAMRKLAGGQRPQREASTA